MYSKLFESMYDGSLRRDWKALVVFQQFLILAESGGFVNKTADAISDRTRIPLDFIEYGIHYLSQPDPISRSQESEGRRIVLINPDVPWGWKIVNYEVYREIKTAEQLRDYWRGRQQEFREKRADRTLHLKALVGAMYHRKPDDNWPYLEECLLAEVARRKESVEEFEEIKRYRARNGKYFPQSASKLLEGWVSIIDRARSTTSKRREVTL